MSCSLCRKRRLCGRSGCHRLGKRNATSRGQSHGSGGPKGVLSKGRDSSKWRQGSDNTKKWSGGIPDAFPSGKRAEDYRRPGRYRNRRHLLPGAEGDQARSDLITLIFWQILTSEMATILESWRMSAPQTISFSVFILLIA